MYNLPAISKDVLCRPKRLRIYVLFLQRKHIGCIDGSTGQNGAQPQLLSRSLTMHTPFSPSRRVAILKMQDAPFSVNSRTSGRSRRFTVRCEAFTRASATLNASISSMIAIRRDSHVARGRLFRMCQLRKRVALIVPTVRQITAAKNRLIHGTYLGYVSAAAADPECDARRLAAECNAPAGSPAIYERGLCSISASIVD